MFVLIRFPGPIPNAVFKGAGVACSGQALFVGTEGKNSWGVLHKLN